MKKIRSLAAALPMMAAAFTASATGWPAGYEGVMLQAFYWDSYSDTRWSRLADQADELSGSFDLIWVPNSGRCSGSQNMGYMPVYWFTNHNSSFGPEAALTNMIAKFKERGTGVIADVVVNHRVGVSNWTDFPAEEWNGRTWQLGPEHICCDDEVAGASGQARPTGARDTGENFDGARDLDHTNATVQDHIKNYCKCLLEKYGYTGFRLDMVKGYAGRFTKIYNQYAKPQFCVGEYWDGYDAIAAWIESTGRESAAFDFPCKYALNEAFSSGNLTKLVWKANGSVDQPAGLIHFGYPQYAVTFVDNHDTYRDGSKFTGNVLAANAFILSAPGTPCVFLPHWKSHKEQIKKMIAARKAAGVSNTSTVRVLKTASNVYLAEVQGSKAKLAVRIGNTSDVPSGYTADDLYTSGNGYAIWVKDSGMGGGGDDPGDNLPASLYVLGNLADSQWNTASGALMSRNGNTYTASNVEFTAAAGETKCFFNITTTLASSWDELNGAANRYGAAAEGTGLTLDREAPITLYACGVDASNCKSWAIAPGKYDLVVDLARMTIKLLTAGSSGIEGITSDNPDTEAPAEYYTPAGVRVTNPGTGLYIVRRGTSVTKEYLR